MHNPQQVPGVLIPESPHTHTRFTFPFRLSSQTDTCIAIRFVNARDGSGVHAQSAALGVALDSESARSLAQAKRMGACHNQHRAAVARWLSNSWCTTEGKDGHASRKQKPPSLRDCATSRFPPLVLHVGVPRHCRRRRTRPPQRATDRPQASVQMNQVALQLRALQLTCT